MKTKKRYVKPKLEEIELVVNDIITASSCPPVTCTQECVGHTGCTMDKCSENHLLID
ncbi:MAG: hypothetical protein Q4E88_00265 [Coriobacteriia bacterium]|nr:hypothetical protein [Coriobacteriia bacterium]MDO5328535.1 hypothetical protein [Coriobacteriia bacterium]